MYAKSNKKVKVVSATTAEEFESKINSVLNGLNEKRINYDLQLNPTAGFIAFVTYTETVQVPETLADEYELKGERHKCGECPHFPVITDGRVKWVRCPVTQGLVNKGTNCCDTFYKEVMEGAEREGE